MPGGTDRLGTIPGVPGVMLGVLMVPGVCCGGLYVVWAWYPVCTWYPMLHTECAWYPVVHGAWCCVRCLNGT